MLGAFVGLSAAASPNGHGNSAAAHANNGNGGEHGNSSHGNSSHGNSASSNANNGRGHSDDADDRDDGTRPGWGCGDKNHVHTGPPGGGDGFDPCTFHVRTSTQTVVSGTTTETLTTTETVTGTETSTVTTTETGTTTSST